MPIYEYKCSACRHELEAIQKFADALLVTCPACGKEALTKLVSAAGFQLKGSGWYQTDFKGSGAKPAAKVDSAKTEAGSPDAGKAGTPADGAKSTEAKPTPVAPAATTGSTPASGA